LIGYDNKVAKEKEGAVEKNCGRARIAVKKGYKIKE